MEMQKSRDVRSGIWNCLDPERSKHKHWSELVRRRQVPAAYQNAKACRVRAWCWEWAPPALSGILGGAGPLLTILKLLSALPSKSALMEVQWLRRNSRRSHQVVLWNVDRSFQRYDVGRMNFGRGGALRAFPLFQWTVDVGDRSAVGIQHDHALVVD